MMERALRAPASPNGVAARLNMLEAEWRVQRRAPALRRAPPSRLHSAAHRPSLQLRSSPPCETRRTLHRRRCQQLQPRLQQSPPPQLPHQRVPSAHPSQQPRQLPQPNLRPTMGGRALCKMGTPHQAHPTTHLLLRLPRKLHPLLLLRLWRLRLQQLLLPLLLSRSPLLRQFLVPLSTVLLVVLLLLARSSTVVFRWVRSCWRGCRGPCRSWRV